MMTDTNIIIEVAKLDNFTLEHTVWTSCSELCDCDPQEGHWIEGKYPPYLTSRDTIIPVIEKVCKDQAIKVKFLNNLRDLVAHSQDLTDGPIKVSDFNLIVAQIKLLSIALLKATGNWEE